MKTVIVEQAFNTNSKNLWKAITDVNEMRHWFFGNIPDFKPEVGFETQFNVHAGDRTFLHIWKIAEVIPYKKIVYNWRYGGYDGNSYVNFELFETDFGASLRVTHSGIETFPQDVPEFSSKSCRQGWKYFIKQSLPGYLKHS